MPNRREILQTSLTAVAATLLAGKSTATIAQAMKKNMSQQFDKFWPDNAQLVISISMQFEATSQSAIAEGPFPALDPQYPDTITPSWYRYGILEGIPRLLNLWDKHGVKVTSHMVGLAVERNPDLARQIVLRGHEASGHGQTWAPQYSMSPEEERASYIKSANTIERITGQRPLGFNAFWMRHSRHTLEILQDLGFIYHIDDLARDEPSIIPVRNRPFAIVPYTLRNNDIVRVGNSSTMTSAAFAQELKDEFDVLYAEGTSRRRMMSFSVHDRVAGTPSMIHALDDFLTYAKKHPRVSFMRKDAIAHWALSQPNTPHNPPRTFD